MHKSVPDFLLDSSEGYGLNERRECYRIRRFAAAGRDDYLLIRISPPFSGSPENPLNEQIDHLIIAPRHTGESLFDIKKWPIAVYVLRPLGENVQTRASIGNDELVMLGWAEIYPAGG